MAQPVKHPTVDISSGHDLVALGIEPCVRVSADGVEPTWDYLSPLSLPLRLLALSLSLKINK